MRKIFSFICLGALGLASAARATTPVANINENPGRIWLWAGPSFAFYRYSATLKTNSTAATQSGLAPGLNFELVYALNETLHLHFDLYGAYLFTRSPLNGTLVVTTPFLYEVNGGLRWSPLKKFPLHLRGDVGILNQFFLPATSPNSLTLDSILRPELKLGFHYRVLSRGDFKGWANAELLFLFGGSSAIETVSTSLGFRLGVYSRFHAGNISTEAGVYGALDNATTSLTNQSTLSAGLKLSFNVFAPRAVKKN